MGFFPAPPAESETLELLGRIRAGREEAWNELFRRHHDQLLLVIRAQLGPRLRGCLESEDVFQSVALEAFEALERFEYRGEGSLRHFLNRLVLNKIRDRADTFGALKRSGAVPLTDSLLASVPDPDGPHADGGPRYHDAERYERLERALARLPEEMREVLLLRKVDGLASKEVARHLQKSDAAVRKLYSRALARLTSLMGGGSEGA